jgi:hypothetical protein
MFVAGTFRIDCADDLRASDTSNPSRLRKEIASEPARCEGREANGAQHRAGRSGDRDNPLVPSHRLMRALTTLIGGERYGLWSCEPHLRAEHMANKACDVKKVIANRSRPHMAPLILADRSRACPLSERPKIIDGRSKWREFLTDRPRRLPCLVLT